MILSTVKTGWLGTSNRTSPEILFDLIAAQNSAKRIAAKNKFGTKEKEPEIRINGTRRN